MVSLLALVFVLNSVRISVDQDGGLTHEQIASVVDQMQRIWRGAGVSVTAGRPGDPAQPDQAVVSLRVVRFSVPPNNRAEPILAWVAVGDGRVPAPVLFVSLPTVIQVLAHAQYGGYALEKLTNEVLAELTAQAIGRAAAHELGHYLLQRVGHGRQGLMRRSYSANDLVGAWLVPFQVAAEDRPRVLSEIATLARSQHSF